MIVKERPILFSTEMVKAILEGRKTQTRRLNGLDEINQFPDKVELVDHLCDGDRWGFKEKDSFRKGYPISGIIKCPYGAPGDHLWVKETHYRYGKWLKNGLTPTGRQKWRFKPLNNEIHFDTDDLESLDIKPTAYRKEAWYKRPSIFLPKGYHRIDLEITDIRVERVRDITNGDAMAEGVRGPLPVAFDCFMLLWDSINAKRGYPWKDNSWVWVVEFKWVTA